MICKKCGKEAGEGIYCPFCGSKLTEAENANTKAYDSNSETNNLETKTSYNEIELEENTPFDFTKISKESEEAMGDNPYSFGITPVNNKKKWPMITAIVAAVLIIVGIGTYFAYPLIMQLINPKDYAVEALEKTTAKMQSGVNDIIDNADFSKTVTPQEVTMNLHLDNMNLESNSALSEFSGKDVILTMQSSNKDNTMTGNISLANGNSSSVSMDFYLDASTLKFKIPKLSSKTFSVDISSSLGSSSGVMNYADSFLVPSQLQKNKELFAEPIKAVIQDVLKGVNVTIENSKYNKTGNETYHSDNGDIKVSVYDVNITEDAVKKGVIAIINNIFDDSKLSSYTSLIAVYTGKTKQGLISAVESANLDINDIPFTIYINKDKEVVKYSLDLNKMISTESGTISVGFIGKSNIYNYMVLEVNDPKEVTGKIIAQNDEDGFNYQVTISSNNLLTNQTIDYGMKGTKQKTDNDVLKYSIEKLYFKGKIDNQNVDIVTKGDISTKSISSLSNNASSFSNALNLNNMTNEQKKNVLTEVSNNLNNLKGIISDSAINQLKTEINSTLATIK